MRDVWASCGDSVGVLEQMEVEVDEPLVTLDRDSLVHSVHPLQIFRSKEDVGEAVDVLGEREVMNCVCVGNHRR